MIRPLALAEATIVAFLAVSGAGGAKAQAPDRGGSLVMGTLREPACLNAFLERCHGGLPPAGHIMNLVLRGAFQVGPGYTWRPDLVSRVERTRTAPFALTYHIRPNARWSDGVAITARDFLFTHDTLLKLEALDRESLGLEFVRSVREIDARTVRVVLRSRYGGWQTLFSNVLPQHALRRANFSTVWLNGIVNPKTARPIGSGPFLVAGWERGRALTFVRNPRYWGAHRAYLDRLILRFCRQCGDIVSEQIEWLRTNEIDLAAFIGPSGQQVQEFRRLPGVRVIAVPGPVWEHIDIRIGPGGHPALKRKRVRRALAFGIDRVAITRALYGTGYPMSDSVVFLSGSTHYRPNWSTYRARPTEARRLLEQEGCRKGIDAIYVCGGDRLSLRFVTTADDPVRVQTLQFLQRQLRQLGIEVLPTYGTRGAVFNQILESGDFDLILFSFIQSSPAAVALGDYECGGPENYSGYCQRLVTRDLDQAGRILDSDRLAFVLHRADVQLAKDVPVIPLVERPLLAAFRTSVRNVNLSTRAWNPFANAENWRLAD